MFHVLCILLWTTIIISSILVNNKIEVNTSSGVFYNGMHISIHFFAPIETSFSINIRDSQRISYWIGFKACAVRACASNIMSLLELYNTVFINGMSYFYSNLASCIWEERFIYHGGYTLFNSLKHPSIYLNKCKIGLHWSITMGVSLFLVGSIGVLSMINFSCQQETSIGSVKILSTTTMTKKCKLKQAIFAIMLYISLPLIMTLLMLPIYSVVSWMTWKNNWRKFIMLTVFEMASFTNS